jgi:hypothetical protein
MDSRRATSAEVSSKLISACWVYPYATNLALFLIITLLSSSLFLKTYFVPIITLLFDLGISFHT